MATLWSINQAYRYNNTLGEVVIGLRAKAAAAMKSSARPDATSAVTWQHC